MKREHLKLAALATAALLLASGSAAAQSATTEPGDGRAEKKRTKAKTDRRDHGSQGTTSDTQGDASIRGDVKSRGTVKTPQN